MSPGPSYYQVDIIPIHQPFMVVASIITLELLAAKQIGSKCTLSERQLLLPATHHQHSEKISVHCQSPHSQTG